MKTYLNIGLDFVCADGNRQTNIQLVHQDSGKAIAIADFTNGKITRTAAIDSVDKKAFLKQAFELFNNSIPVAFRKTALPA